MDHTLAIKIDYWAIQEGENDLLQLAEIGRLQNEGRPRWRHWLNRQAR